LRQGPQDSEDFGPLLCKQKNQQLHTIALFNRPIFKRAKQKPSTILPDTRVLRQPKQPGTTESCTITWVLAFFCTTTQAATGDPFWRLKKEKKTHTLWTNQALDTYPKHGTSFTGSIGKIETIGSVGIGIVQLEIRK
jgi:hypothetical protein